MSRATAQRDNLAVLVRRKEAMAAIKDISKCGHMDFCRKVLQRRSLVEIPTLIPMPGYRVVCQDKPEFYRRTPELKDILNNELDSEQIELLPRGWYILGDVILVKIQPQLDHLVHAIGQALLSIYPRCRSVVRDFGIEGPLREPVREIIAGETSETVHRENGVLFKLDAVKIMFSQGNLRERMRMSRMGKDERIVDMFAGIGYFSLPMAVHSRPKEVVAIELNPAAYRYLLENVRLNHVESIIRPVLGDCSKKTPSGKADRVIMGLVGTTKQYLMTGIKALRLGGVLHYHQTIPSWRYPHEAEMDVVEACRQLDLTAQILRCVRVKKYSPGIVHVVVDACIGKDS